MFLVKGLRVYCLLGMDGLERDLMRCDMHVQIVYIILLYNLFLKLISLAYLKS